MVVPAAGRVGLGRDEVRLVGGYQVITIRSSDMAWHGRPETLKSCCFKFHTYIHSISWSYLPPNIYPVSLPTSCLFYLFRLLKTYLHVFECHMCGGTCDSQKRVSGSWSWLEASKHMC